MIKEIMLASALTIAPNIYPQVNLDYVGNEIEIDFMSFDIGSFSQLVININTGYMFCCNLDYIGSDDNVISWQVHDKTDYATCDFYNYGDYLQAGLREMGYNSNSDISNLYFFCDGPIITFDGTTSVSIDIPCFLASPGEDDSVLLQTSETSSLILDGEYFEFEFGDFYSNDIITSDNLFLVLDINDIVFSSANDRLIFASLFVRYVSFYISDDNDTSSNALTFSEFVYQDETNLREFSNKLIQRNEELDKINQELIRENEELRGKAITGITFGSVIKIISDNAAALLKTEILPNFTIGNIIFIPVIFSLIGIIFKFFRR